MNKFDIMEQEVELEKYETTNARAYPMLDLLIFAGSVCGFISFVWLIAELIGGLL